MSNVPSASEFEQAQRVDALCDEFEAALLADKQPRIEDWLARVPSHERRLLLKELLAIEHEFAARRGDPLECGHYLGRFGEFADVVFAVLGNLPPTGSTQRTLSREPPPSVGEPSSVSGLGDDASARELLGRFRAVRPHAEGGLGRIWRAVDAELKREVALKEIRPEQAGHRERRERFVLEAEVTGRLEHPGIVPVYGLGLAADGRPFYAMRLIQGQSLAETIATFHRGDRSDSPFSATRTLELRKLLARLVEVCNALDFAHSRGIVHRDIKPSNIMLGDYGETLVVDWGLAKVLENSEAPPLATHPSNAGLEAPGTEANSVFGTPHYMSPEQARGETGCIGPASDVYSLGATLYHLLVGRPAFAGVPRERLLEAVRRGEFPAPRLVCAAVPRPLEAICLKAMALKPEDRYISARQLADDLEHWLADEPVLAWREPWHAQAARFGRRHRHWVQAGTAALLLIAVAMSGATWLVNKARLSEADERRRAEKSEAAERIAADQAREERKAAVAAKELAEESERRARAATEFLVSTFESADPLGLHSLSFRRVEDQNRQLTAREILERGRQRIETKLSHEPLTLASLCDALGLAYLGLGEFDRAQPLLDRALQIRQQKLPPDHPDLLASLMSQAHSKLVRGETQQAEDLLRTVLAGQAKAHVPPLAVATTQFYLGVVLSEEDRHAEAEPLFRQALAVRERELGPQHSDTVMVRLMLIANLAGQGKSEEVGLEQLLKLAPAAGANVPLFFKLFAYWRTAPTRRRTDMQAAIAELLAMRAEVHATLGTTHPIATAFEFHYAVLLLEQGNVREAERVGGAALNNLPRVLASNPLVAEPHCKFGQLLAARGNSLDAERHLREAMRLGAGRPIKGRRWDWEAAMSLANLKHAQGDVRAAEQLVRDALHAPDNTHLREGAHRTLLPLLLDLGQFQEAVEIARHYYTMFWPQRANDPEVAVYWSQVYAQCLRDQADYGTLRWIETEALAFVRDYLSQRESDLSRGGVRRLAQFLTEQSDFSAAERLWNISLEQSRNAHRPESPALAADLASVAEYFRDRAQFNQAQPLWEETVRISSAQLGSDHLTTTGVQLQLALTELAMELPEESLARARAAYETRLEAQGADDLRTHAAARTLAQVLLAQKQFDEAEKLLHAAAAFHAQRLPPTDSRLWQAHVDLADLYLAKADYAAAVSFLQSSRDTLQPALAPRSWRLAEIESRLGQAFSTQNRFSEAEPLLFHSFAVLREAWSSADQRFRQARDRLLTHYEATGNHPSAESLRSQFP